MSCPPHTWDDEGERCVKCGTKDWMSGPTTPAIPLMHGIEIREDPPMRPSASPEAPPDTPCGVCGHEKRLHVPQGTPADVTGCKTLGCRCTTFWAYTPCRTLMCNGVGEVVTPDLGGDNQLLCKECVMGILKAETAKLPPVRR